MLTERFLPGFLNLWLKIKFPEKLGAVEFDLLMFPPLWPWLHAGNKPIDKPKYILGSYLHYK